MHDTLDELVLERSISLRSFDIPIFNLYNNKK